MLEEGWPSMDLVAEMLLTHLGRPGGAFQPVLLRAGLHQRLGRFFSSNGQPPTIDRIINRFYDYPRWLRARTSAADVFHLLDHSYAHLVDELPRGRVVVTCHDTDAFRGLLNGSSESKLPLRLARRVLAGLRRADVVSCVSETTRRELVTLGLVPAEKTEVVANGVHPSCSPSPDPAADAAATVLLEPERGPLLLHVGSTIARKRIDVLLRVLRDVAADRPNVRLVRVGGEFTAAQRHLASDLAVAGRIVVLPFLDRAVLAAVYRRASLVLLPSEREGFGLPLIESMACGTPVVASDIDVFREVGGEAASYAPLGDIGAWRRTVVDLLDEQSGKPLQWNGRRATALARASKYSWASYARQMETLYMRLPGAQRKATA
jgi:glycosyltransferase involved in cell wall biosynthesis